MTSFTLFKLYKPKLTLELRKYRLEIIIKLELDVSAKLIYE